MLRMRKIAESVGALFRQWWALLRRWIGLGAPEAETVYKVQRVDDEPAQAQAGIVYVIEDAGIEWAAVMSCPGGCGQLLHMNLIPDSEPVWKLIEDESGAATLSPSVWRKEVCGCHFILRQGKVQWCQ